MLFLWRRRPTAASDERQAFHCCVEWSHRRDNQPIAATASHLCSSDSGAGVWFRRRWRQIPPPRFASPRGVSLHFRRRTSHRSSRPQRSIRRVGRAPNRNAALAPTGLPIGRKVSIAASNRCVTWRNRFLPGRNACRAPMAPALGEGSYVIDCVGHSLGWAGGSGGVSVSADGAMLVRCRNSGSRGRMRGLAASVRFWDWVRLVSSGFGGAGFGNVLFA